MGSGQSHTAEDYCMIDCAKKGAQAVGLFGATVLLSPFVIVALPVIGAYEFGTALEEELLTGSTLIDGVIGTLFGLMASPLAPFYVFWDSMETLFYNPPPPKIVVNEAYQKQAKDRLGIDASYYNVAVIGCAGTGKSSLVNGLLGYKDRHVRAAAVGETETTTEPKGYHHPLLPTLMIWDFPGAGTQNQPANQYFEACSLGIFDALIIVSTDRLMAVDVKLARRALKYRIPVFFIRNKADLAIQSKIRKLSIDSTDETKLWWKSVIELTREVEHTFYRSLKYFGFDGSQLYIVSAWTLQEFVVSLRDHKPVSHLRMIHEKILLTRLLDQLSVKRKNEYLIDGRDTQDGKASIETNQNTLLRP
ncbi:interferon-inducible GTPase-domain-containing protein [Radiomyces spectabilis]|uniref:interferon-inducible GTPase-domain-containing protein n=1 Tax=Radiomyces spectabilis TaxID=64574 RepID=UPI002220F93A|nr:interferon-inducible GTPase-domain-containing protein [Radiomyces spectabilis]KAI8388744.1 interferon-inducible GTPase-domain-containing protein [Radiomyces spectabilis]